MNEKLIYEWLRELPHDCFIYTHLNGETVASGEDEKGPWEDPLPPLDMNTWYRECVPRLNAEGWDVSFYTWADWRGRQAEWSLNEDQFVNALPYDALTEYLEAK